MANKKDWGSQKPTVFKGFVFKISFPSFYFFSHIKQYFLGVKKMKTKQHQAITLILLGKSDRDICQQLEINPKTLWKWKTKNKFFMQEIEAQKEELLRQNQTSIDLIVRKSIEVILKSLNSNETKTAIEMLKIFKPMQQQQQKNSVDIDLSKIDIDIDHEETNVIKFKDVANE